jgi:DNA polymerase
MRVLVAQSHHEADRDLVVRLMIDPAAAPSIGQGPALRVNNLAGLVLGGIDIPQFLDADAVDLRLAITLEVEDALHLLGEVAARALCKESVAGVQLHAGLVVGSVRTVARHAHVAGRDALHRAVLVEQHFGRRETWGRSRRPERFRPAPRASAAQIASER